MNSTRASLIALIVALSAAVAAFVNIRSSAEFAASLSSVLVGAAVCISAVAVVNARSSAKQASTLTVRLEFLSAFAKLEKVLRSCTQLVIGASRAGELRYDSLVRLVLNAGVISATDAETALRARVQRNAIAHDRSTERLNLELAKELNALIQKMENRYSELAAGQPDSVYELADALVSKQESSAVDIARALLHRGNVEAANAKYKEALSSISESVSAFRRLDDEHLISVADELAITFGEKSDLELRLGLTDAATQSAEEAVSACRKSNYMSDPAHRHTLAGALNNLSNRYADVGHTASALDPAIEAVELLRELSESTAPGYIPDLIRAQNTLASRCLENGQPDAAAHLAAEASNSAERLVKRDSNEQELLARVLGTLSQALFEIGERDGALEVARRSIAIRESLAAEDFEKFGDELAIGLTNLSSFLGYLGQNQEALGAALRAVETRRNLPADKLRQREFLSNALNNSAAVLMQLGRPGEAVRPMTEAIDIRRQLAAESPLRYRLVLADGLNNLTAILARDNRRDEASAVADEALDLARKEYAAGTSGAEEILGTALNNKSVRLAEEGRYAEALGLVDEALEIRTRLHERNPEKYAPNLAMSLAGKASRLSELERYEEAIGPSRQARKLRERLFRQYPRAFGWPLIRSMTQERDLLARTGSTDAAAKLDETITEMVGRSVDELGDLDSGEEVASITDQGDADRRSP